MKALLVICLAAFIACNQVSSLDPAEVVKCILEDEHLFADIGKLIEAITSGDITKILPVVIEVYPHIAALVQKCFSSVQLQALPIWLIEIIISILGPIAKEWIHKGLEFLYNKCVEKKGANFWLCKEIKKHL